MSSALKAATAAFSCGSPKRRRAICCGVSFDSPSHEQVKHVSGQLGRMAQLGLSLLLAFVAGNASADISFVAGDYYTSEIVPFTQGDPALRTITQYDPCFRLPLPAASKD